MTTSWILATAAAAAIALMQPAAAPAPAAAPSPAPRAAYTLTADDQALLEDLSRRSFRFFWEQADPSTGIVRDRARLDGSPLPASHREIGSIASTGFGLTALCIAAERA